MFTFQTICVVADINHTYYQLAGILICMFYCYRIRQMYLLSRFSYKTHADTDKTHNNDY
jgi:hypothetical protein